MPQVNPGERDPSVCLVERRKKAFSKIMSQAVKWTSLYKIQRNNSFIHISNSFQVVKPE